MRALAFVVAALLVVLFSQSAALALLCGLTLSLLVGNPLITQTRRLAPWILQASVVGLGASMNLGVVLRVGLQGVGYTVVGIGATLLCGFGLARLLAVPKNTSLLVSAGTAICGGSAIAAVASAICAEPAEIAFAMMTVFLLNAAALVVFPPLGHALSLSQEQFGYFGALAIHDTSSVVGAAGQYGARALEIATIVKLTRTLWILPLTFVVAMLWSRKNPSATGQAKKPWFVLGFLLASALGTLFPALSPVAVKLTAVAKKGMVLSLFLIGANLSRSDLHKLSLRPFVLGLLLWCAVSAGTLLAILKGLIHGE